MMRSRRVFALSIASALLLSGCASATPGATSAPTTEATSASTPSATTAADPNPTTSSRPALPSPGLESDDITACENVNRAVNFLFTAAAESTRYTDDPERLYRGGMALLFAGYELDLRDDIATDLGVIVEIFTERSGTTVDGVEPYWDVAKAYVDAPNANPLTEPLATAAETCGEAGYTWKNWSVDS